MSWIRWLKNLVRQNRKPQEPIFLGKQVPVNQSLEFTSHKLFIEKIFSFLVDEWGFPPPSSGWQSREYHTVYMKEEVEVEIIFETGMLPHVSVSKGTEGDPDFSCHNIAVLDTEGNFRRLYEARFARVNPKEERWLDRVEYDNVYDHREIEEDYRQWGRAEHEKILCLYASLIKKHSEILKGNFTSFSSTSQKDQENSNR